MNSRRWIVLGTLLLICSVLILVIGVVFSLSRFNMKQVLMPGTVEFTMDTPGPFFLAYEPRTDYEGTLYVSPEDSTFTFELESLDDGASASIEKPLVSANYRIGGRRGRYIGKANLSAGSWKLIGRASAGDDHRAVYAYGRTPIASIVIPIIISVLATALIGPIGLGLLVVGLILRVQARKRAMSASKSTAEG